MPVRRDLLPGAALSVLIAVACGDSVQESSDAAPPLAARTATPGCGSFRTNSCAKGTYCFGPPACGATWACQKEMPCSAAAPSLSCDCGGRIVSTSAGCGERRAYGLYEALGDFGGGAKVGDPCDPARAAPYSVRIEVSGSGLSELDGGRVWLRSGSAAPAWFPAGGVTVQGGRFEHVASSVPTASGSASVLILLDRNGDGRCSAEDRVYQGGPTQTDAQAFVLRYELVPSTPWSPAACELWR